MSHRVGAAWIVEWVTYRDDVRSRLDPRPHILPYRWRTDQIKDYMRVLFWNSSPHNPFSALAHVNERNPSGIIAADMRYGDATHLRAIFTRDLKIFREGEKIIMEWTQPGRRELDRKQGEFVKVSDDIPRRVELPDR